MSLKVLRYFFLLWKLCNENVWNYKIHYWKFEKIITVCRKLEFWWDLKFWCRVFYCGRVPSHFLGYLHISIWLSLHLAHSQLGPHIAPPFPLWPSPKICLFDKLIKRVPQFQKYPNSVQYWWWLHRLKLKSFNVENFDVPNFEF